MLASVIIRTYNESRHLGEVLRRLDQQELDRSEFEVIIVDSGSTDPTQRLLERRRSLMRFGGRIL